MLSNAQSPVLGHLTERSSLRIRPADGVPRFRRTMTLRRAASPVRLQSGSMYHPRGWRHGHDSTSPDGLAYESAQPAYRAAINRMHGHIGSGMMFR